MEVPVSKLDGWQSNNVRLATADVTAAARACLMSDAEPWATTRPLASWMWRVRQLPGGGGGTDRLA